MKKQYVNLISLQFILLIYSVESGIKKDRILRDGDFSDRIIFTTSREDDPKIWFKYEHPQFEYIGQFWIGTEKFVTGRIRQRNSNERFSGLEEDLYVKNLRLTKEISWVIQEKAQIRVTKTLDAEWPNLWYLNGDVSPSMKVNEAWLSGYTGNGIVIAVVDDGLETDHPDIAANIDTLNDIDIYSNDDDPYPPSGSSHGTEVSGLIAAVKDNNICTVGVAFKSKIIGVRILGNAAILDSEEAQALIHKINYVDIYSNSWGPADGSDFSQPGPLTKKAIKEGVTNGRKGKGAIYLWASGNGGVEDNCNADAYASSIYTIAITAVEIGQNAWYAEVCACAMAATYGGSSMDRFITTTTTSFSCISDGIEGTSYATPIASGIVALCLEANPNLTWRDIQHLIVLTSSRNGLSDTYLDWAINGAYKECKSSTGITNGINVITIARNECQVVFLEHVTTNITFSYSAYRGASMLYLVSPKGTRSHLLHHRVADGNHNTAGSLTWTFMSVHFWSESPVGNWTLEFGSHTGISIVTFQSWSLTFYGTSTDPLSHVDQCSSSPCPGNNTCVNLVYKYVCCPGGYTGAQCDIFVATSKKPTSNTSIDITTVSKVMATNTVSKVMDTTTVSKVIDTSTTNKVIDTSTISRLMETITTVKFTGTTRDHVMDTGTKDNAIDTTNKVINTSITTKVMEPSTTDKLMGTTTRDNTMDTSPREIAMETSTMDNEMNLNRTDKVMDTTNNTMDTITLAKVIETSTTYTLMGTSTTKNIMYSNTTDIVINESTSEKAMDIGTIKKATEEATTHEMMDTSTTDLIIKATTNNKVMERNTINQLLNTGTTHKLMDTSTTDKVMDTSTTDKLMDTITTDKVIDTRTTDKMIDTSTTDRLMDTRVTAKMMDTGTTAKMMSARTVSATIESTTDNVTKITTVESTTAINKNQSASYENILGYQWSSGNVVADPSLKMLSKICLLFILFIFVII